jgi:uncharacterized domain HDIG
LKCYRFKQFLWNLNFKLNNKEKLFIKQHLKEKDLNLFNRLSVSEKKHSIRVAIEVQSRYDELKKINKLNVCKESMIVAALLHDIGKVYIRLNVIDKSILVILDKITKGKIKKYNNIKKIDIYYNHAQIGASLLKENNYDESIILLVENHHDNLTQCAEVKLLNYCDNKN